MGGMPGMGGMGGMSGMGGFRRWFLCLQIGKQ